MAAGRLLQSNWRNLGRLIVWSLIHFFLSHIALPGLLPTVIVLALYVRIFCRSSRKLTDHTTFSTLFATLYCSSKYTTIDGREISNARVRTWSHPIALRRSLISWIEMPTKAMLTPIADECTDYLRSMPEASYSCSPLLLLAGG